MDLESLVDDTVLIIDSAHNRLCLWVRSGEGLSCLFMFMVSTFVPWDPDQGKKRRNIQHININLISKRHPSGTLRHLQSQVTDYSPRTGGIKRRTV